MNIANWLYASALVNPGAPALLSGAVIRADYLRFAQEASSLGHCLKKNYGIKEGDRVAIYMKNRLEYLLLFYACWWIGAVVVPINYRLHAKEAAWIVDNAQACLVFSDDGSLSERASLGADCHEVPIDHPAFQTLLSAHDDLSAPAALNPDSLAWLFYTSGTTGRPKGVMLSHDNLVAMSLCYTMDVDDVSSDDAALYAAPMSHGAGLYNFVYVRRAARHVVPMSGGFDSQEILALAKQVGNVSFFAAPTMVKRLIKEATSAQQTGEGIKSIVYGGGPMYAADIKEAVAALGSKFIQIYGQGESPMTITSLQRELIADVGNPKWEERLRSVGVAQSSVEIRIVNEQLCDLPTGVPGEIIVRSNAVMLGYWQNETATRQALVDGWLKTGDIGYLNEQGFLTLTDRSKDVIISGGTNIYPREVEEVLARHPAVAEVAVVGRPHPEWGEEVIAFIVCAEQKPLNEIELDAWCKGEIASFKKPKLYKFCSELPKNNYGKVLKTELRKWLESAI